MHHLTTVLNEGTRWKRNSIVLTLASSESLPRRYFAILQSKLHVIAVTYAPSSKMIRVMATDRPSKARRRRGALTLSHRLEGIYRYLRKGVFNISF